MGAGLSDEVAWKVAAVIGLLPSLVVARDRAKARGIRNARARRSEAVGRARIVL